MKLRELINTCQNDITQYYIYFDEDTWANETPDVEAADVRELGNALGSINRYVDAWYLDVNFVLHVLI